METRQKRLHYSPGPKDQIACGVTKRGGRRVRYTKVADDVTCDLCLKTIQVEALNKKAFVADLEETCSSAR